VLNDICEELVYEVSAGGREEVLTRIEAAMRGSETLLRFALQSVAPEKAAAVRFHSPVAAAAARAGQAPDESALDCIAKYVDYMCGELIEVRSRSHKYSISHTHLIITYLLNRTHSLHSLTHYSPNSSYDKVTK
jgi:hypothetical protein